MHKYKIAIMELGVLDMKTHVRITPCAASIHQQITWMGASCPGDEVLKRWVLSKSCLFNGVGCLGLKKIHQELRERVDVHSFV